MTDVRLASQPDPTSGLHQFDSPAFHQAMSAGAPNAVLKAVLECMNKSPQRSDAWFQARRSVVITGSRLSGLLFLETPQQLIEWRQELLGLRPRQPFDALAMARIEFGRKYEDLATVATTKVMASSGYKVDIFEAGFTRHPVSGLTGASPDGVVLWKAENNRPANCTPSGVMNFELKCSTKATGAHTSVPYYYLGQLMFEMRHLSAASGHPVRQTLFSSWSVKNHKVKTFNPDLALNTITNPHSDLYCDQIWLVQFSDALWDQLWMAVVEVILLDTSDPHEVARLVDRLGRLREACTKFSATPSVCTALHPRGGWPAWGVPDDIQLPGTT